MQMLWEYKSYLVKDPRFETAAQNFCKEELQKVCAQSGFGLNEILSVSNIRVATVRNFFFKVREKSGNFASGQGNSKFLVKVSEKSGNFIFRLPQALIMIFFMDKRQCPFKKYPLINAKAGH